MLQQVSKPSAADCRAAAGSKPSAVDCCAAADPKPSAADCRAAAGPKPSSPDFRAAAGLEAVAMVTVQRPVRSAAARFVMVTLYVL